MSFIYIWVFLTKIYFPNVVSFTKEPERSRGPSHWGLYSNSVVFAAHSCVCLSLSIKKANSGTQGLRLLYRFDSIVNRRETNKQKPALLSLESHPSCSLRAGFLGCSLLRLPALGQCLGHCKWLETTGWKEKNTHLPSAHGSHLFTWPQSHSSHLQFLRWMQEASLKWGGASSCCWFSNADPRLCSRVGSRDACCCRFDSGSIKQNVSPKSLIHTLSRDGWRALMMPGLL